MDLQFPSRKIFMNSNCSGNILKIFWLFYATGNRTITYPVAWAEEKDFQGGITPMIFQQWL